MKPTEIKRRFRLTGEAAVSPPTREELTNVYGSLLARLDHALEACANTGGNGSKVVLITASQLGEGCSTTGLNLGLCLTKRDATKVLMVECTGEGAEPIRDAAAKVGWMDVAHHGVALEEALQSVRGSRLYVLPRGGTPDATARTISDEEVGKLIARLREAFPYVIVDGPSLLAQADLSKWLRHVDGVALVIEANRTRREALTPRVKFLAESGAPFLGAILNKRKNFIPDWIYERL